MFPAQNNSDPAKFKRLISTITGLIALGVLFFVLYQFIRFLFGLFSQINPTVGAGMIAATATIIVSVLSVLGAKHLEHKAVLLKEHRERKTPIYEEMVALIFRFAFSQKLGLEPLTDEEIVKKMAWFTENLVIWGSDDLLLAWNRFRTYTVNNADNPNLEILFEIEKLLLAIRRDLGHSNKDVTEGKILGLFVNDIDDYMKTRNV